MEKIPHWFYVSFPISGYAGNGNIIIKVFSDSYENAIPLLWGVVQRRLNASLEDFTDQMFEEFHEYIDDYGFRVATVHDVDVMTVGL